MAIWLVILLGAVQGLTEFLPVSSSGHLLIVQNLLGNGTAQENMYFDLALHVGSAFAVIAVCRRKIRSLFRKENRKMLWFLAVATLPAALVGALLSSRIAALFSGNFLAYGFICTAFLLLATELFAKRTTHPKPLSLKTALFMGAMQAVAVVPGLSRSGSTIFGGTLSGAKREDVADFSFLMSVPIILGGALYSLFFGEGAPISSLSLVLGAFTAFTFALLSLLWMKKIVATARYYGFSLYLFALGALLVLFPF